MLWVWTDESGGGIVTARDRERVDRLLTALEKARLGEALDSMSSFRRLIWGSLLSGLFRGLGFMLGFTVLGALAAVLLQSLVVDNIPLIGGFLAEVVHAIEARL